MNGKFLWHDYISNCALIFLDKVETLTKQNKILCPESDEDSDEDSSDDSDWEESDEESESELGGYDLDVCPPGCDQVRRVDET